MFSSDLADTIAMCLTVTPHKRPRASSLLNNKIITKHLHHDDLHEEETREGTIVAVEKELLKTIKV